MKLLIDTRNGLAGDIMSAGLIGLGADPDAVTGAMVHASEGLGGARVSVQVKGRVTRLAIIAAAIPDHLHAGDAERYLGAALERSGIAEPWLSISRDVLGVLVNAEAHVHSTHPELKKHFHGHGVTLHEASDIIMDIAGMAAGFRELDIRDLEYLDYVDTGSGTVSFSHGTLDVPTPATRRILDTYGIHWRQSDIGIERTTPTGAAMLAGCRAVRNAKEPPGGRMALAGGTRPLPPVTFHLLEI